MLFICVWVEYLLALQLLSFGSIYCVSGYSQSHKPETQTILLEHGTTVEHVSLSISSMNKHITRLFYHIAKQTIIWWS